MLQQAAQHGLDPADYLPSDASQARPAVLDTAWARYAHDVSFGRTQPAQADPEWYIPVPEPASGTAPDTAPDPAAAAPARPPAHPAYRRLQSALARYRTMAAAGGWPPIEAGPDLRAGDRNPRVESLRNRLRTEGDYASLMGADPWFFEGALQEALGRFQSRHGLRVTGVLDETTLEQLNIPVEARIGQLRATLERWRWLPRDLGPRYVWAHLGRATLEVVENGHTVLSMRTVIGHPDRPTPSFRSDIRQIVFNPPWSVPRSIAIADLLPQQQLDPGFLPAHQIRVFGRGDREIDVERVRWDQLGPDHFPYRLRQDPGPDSSLGRYKIVMDNPWDIYLHDTPARGFFGLRSRSLSSGCLRLEQPGALIEYLSRNDGRTPEDLAARMVRPGTHALNLRQTLPIWLVYLTAWADEDGTAHFRKDFYGRDARLLAHL